MLLKNLGIGTGAKLLSFSLPFLLLMVLNRKLSPEDFAVWLIIQQYMRSIQSFDFGAVSVVTRMMAVFHIKSFSFHESGRSVFRSICCIMIGIGIIAGLAAGAVIYLSIDGSYGEIAFGGLVFVALTFGVKAYKGIPTASKQFFLLDLQVLLSSAMGVFGVLLLSGTTVESVFFAYFPMVLLVELAFFVFVRRQTKWAEGKDDTPERSFSLRDIFTYMGFGAVISGSVSAQRILLTYMISRDLPALDVVKVSIPLMLFTAYSSVANFSARYATQVFAKLPAAEVTAKGAKLYRKYQVLSLLAATAGFNAAALILPPLLPLWLPMLNSQQLLAVEAHTLTMLIAFPMYSMANLARNILVARGKVASASTLDAASNLLVPMALVLAVTVDAPLLVYAYVATLALRLVVQTVRLGTLLCYRELPKQLAFTGIQIALCYIVWEFDEKPLFLLGLVLAVACFLVLARRWNKEL